MDPKRIAAELEIEEAREARDWKAVNEKLVRYRSRLENMLLLEHIYKSEEIFEQKKDMNFARDQAEAALKEDENCLEAHVLLGMVQNEKGETKAALESLKILSTLVRPKTVAVKSLRQLRFVAEGFRILSTIESRANHLGKALAASCDLISVISKTLKEEPKAVPRLCKGIEQALDKAIRKMPEFSSSVEDCRSAIRALRLCLMEPLSNFLNQTKRIMTLRLLFEFDFFRCSPTTWPSYSDEKSSGSTDKTEQFKPKTPYAEAACIPPVVDVETQQCSGGFDVPLSLLLSLERRPAAVSWILERSMGGVPPSDRRWKQLAYSLAACGRAEDALSIIDQCLLSQPNDRPLLLLASSLCLNSLHDPERAHSYASCALSAQKPSSGSSFLPDNVWNAHFHVLAGSSCPSSSDSLKHFRAAVSEAPSDAHSLYSLASFAASSRALPAASSSLAISALLSSPCPVPPARFYRLLSRLRRPRPVLSVALSVRPWDSSLLLSKAQLDLREGDPETAARTAAKAKQSTKSDVLFIRALDANGVKKDEARKAAREALTRASERSEAFSVLVAGAEVEEKGGDAEEAAGMRERAKALCPQCGDVGRSCGGGGGILGADPRVWKEIAEGLREQGREGEARDCLLVSARLTASELMGEEEEEDRKVGFAGE